MQNMTPAQAQTLLQQTDPAPVILDVREQWEFNTVSLPGSILIPMGHLPQHVTERLQPDQTILVLCHHGVRSLHAARYLESIGYTNIINIAGGIDAWARDLDPHMSLY